MIADFYFLNTVPTSTSDTAHGYAVGNTWRNETSASYDLYVCTSATNNAAAWSLQNNIDKLASPIIALDDPDIGINSGYYQSNTIYNGIAVGSPIETQDVDDSGINSGFWKSNNLYYGIALSSIILTSYDNHPYVKSIETEEFVEPLWDLIQVRNISTEEHAEDNSLLLHPDIVIEEHKEETWNLIQFPAITLEDHKELLPELVQIYSIVVEGTPPKSKMSAQIIRKIG